MNKKCALITGASRGIGRACAIEFAKEGYDIIINYLNSEKEACELQEFIMKNYEVDAKIYKCDISNEEMVKGMISKFDKIDVLVNNAGIAIDTLYEDKTVENFKKTLDTNLIGTFLVSKYVSQKMIEKKEGKIINISSTNGIDTNYPESADYDASKAAVISLTKNMAISYAPYINVNTVAPGWVNTDMNKELSEEFKSKELSKIALNRFADPEEIASVVTFLASDKANYINGSVIVVDGGKR